MKLFELKKIIREEIEGVFTEQNNNSPESRSPKDVAKFLKDKITPQMTEKDIIPMIFRAVGEWAKMQQSLGYYKNAKISTLVFNIVQYDEDYIPDVLDELLDLGVKWDRLSTAKQQHPDLFKNNPDFEKKFQ